MKFVFDGARASVLQDNQIALCGYGNDDFLSNLSFDAVFCEGDKETILTINIIKTPIPPSKRIEIQDTDISWMIVVLVDIPESISKEGSLKVSYQRGEKSEEVVKLTGRKIKEITSKMECCLDAVIVKDNTVELRGWVIGKDEVTCFVHEEDSSKQKEASVAFHDREDIICFYPEYEGDKAIGFSVKYPLSREKLYLTIKSGDKKKTQKIIGTNTESNSLFITKLKRNTYKFFLCLKNMGIKVTWQKVKAKMTSKHLKRPKAYDKWIKKRLVTAEQIELQKKCKFDFEPAIYILGKDLDKNTFASQTYNKICSDMADADYVLVWDKPCVPEPDLLYACVDEINKSNSDVIYFDNDQVDLTKNRYMNPNFKSDINIDLLRSQNYIGKVFVVKKTVIDKLNLPVDTLGKEKEYDYLLKCWEYKTKITHVSKCLYHEICGEGTKEVVNEETKKIVEAHLSRIGIKADVSICEDINALKVTYPVIDNPMVSIVIPNKDHVEDLKKCIDSIESLSTYDDYEFVIVENNSTDRETFSYYEEIGKKDNVNIIKWDKEFNYSAINNFGVKHAKGEYVLLLNNDTEIINCDCIEQMLGYCQREDVGIVGARLYYDDGALQHAGVIVGYGGVAGHAFVGLFEKDGLYRNRSHISCDYSAVTAACLMTKKSVFDQVGGLDESFTVAFNDIDFCLKVREQGYLVVYNPNAKLYHYESKSRGLEDTAAKKERFRQETERFLAKWSDILRDGDPYYNVNLALDRPDFSVRG